MSGKILPTIACLLFLAAASGCASTPPAKENPDEKPKSNLEITTVNPVPVAPAEIASDLMALEAPKSAQSPSHAVGPPPPEAANTEPQPQPKTTPPQLIIEYVVKTGDTLMLISYDQLGDALRWREIYDDNRSKIPNPNILTKGTVLLIDRSSVVTVKHEGDPYLIKWRDTLMKISFNLYGTPFKWEKLWKNNLDLIRNPDLIFAGFTIYYLMSVEDRKELEHFREERRLASEKSQAKN